MKKKTIQQTYISYADIDELDEANRTLLLSARKALNDSYSPYSNFRVGAAIRLQNDVIIRGSNQENAAYPMCLCAERVALAAADAQYPDIPVTTIAITVKSMHQTINQPVSPCGACRQVLCETEIKHQQTIRVLAQGETGEIIAFETAKALLPFSFDGTFL